MTKSGSARDEIRALHRQLHRRQRLLIRRRVHEHDPVFQADERRFDRSVRTFERTATFDEVVADAARSDVVLVGDYHTLKQSQRWFLKVARRLVESGRLVVLAFEFAEARHQKEFDAFVAGRIDETELLRRTGCDRRHAFDIRPNFRPISPSPRSTGCRSSGSSGPGKAPLRRGTRSLLRASTWPCEATPARSRSC